MSEKRIRNVMKVPGFAHQIGFSLKDGGKIEIFREENEVISVPECERKYKIYKLLKENCDLKFCFDETSDDFKFIALEYFAIFAVDSNDNCFGTIGDIGDIEDREYPVGYVTADGKCGKVASYFKEFLELVNYYPYWREVIESEKNGVHYSIEEFENTYNMHSQAYIERQEEISKILNLKRNDKSIELLLSSLKDEDQFIVFSHRYDNLI